ncbi:SAM domain and HD [Irineochytrium annulatum]|nr:SAM domain and HD [Irineochytrium annulatum]
MIDYMRVKNGIEIADADIRFIKDLIMGEPEDKKGFGDEGDRRQFFYEIVNNKSTEVDVDKAMKMAHVVNNRVVFPSKESYNFNLLFFTRFNLFKTVYTHRAVMAIDLMIVDALLAADAYFEISAAIDDPVKYTYLTDGIIDRILATDVNMIKDPALAGAVKKSQALLERILTRDLYRFVDQMVIPAESALSDGRIVEKDIHGKVNHKEAYETLLAVKNEERIDIPDSDLILDILKISHCHGDKDPLERIPFSRKADSRDMVHIPSNQISTLRPTHFQELSLRVYVKGLLLIFTYG